MTYSRIILIISYIIAITGSAFSQDYNVKNGGFLFKTYVNYPYQLDYSDINGSPYRIDSLVEGIVWLTNNGKSIEIPMRFNIYEDEIEYLEGNKILHLANKHQLHFAIIGNDRIVFKAYNYDHDNGYFIERVSGPCSLYVRYVIEFKEMKPPKSGYHELEPATFVQKDPTYYYSINDDHLIRVVLSKSGLEKVFGEFSNDLERYKKLEKLKFRNEEDVVELFKQFNKLLNSAGI